MTEKREEPGPDGAEVAGVYLIDKPAGPTSFRMVQMVRRGLGVRKVGHAGTLDPFATGLLLVCVGRCATRLVPKLMGGEKEYEAVLRLGEETDTYDLTGRVTARREVRPIPAEEFASCLEAFVGELEQSPPPFSAVKHQGKPLYRYARQGIVIEKPARRIVIHRLECLAFTGQEATIRVACGKGTYIRTLARDIGERLGCGAHLVALRRTRSGPFAVDAAVSGETLVNADRETIRAALISRRIEVAEALARMEAGVAATGHATETTTTKEPIDTNV